MAGLKGITVNTAPEAEPHIYAEDDAAIYQSIFGPDGVSSIGKKCKATILSNNKVRIEDGVLFVGGHFARIPYGEYVDCEIANGQSGKKRNDIIIAKFVTTGSGGIDTMTCEVKQGMDGVTAADPALTQDDIYNSGKIREFPLYRVKIEGLSIIEVEQMFDVVPTNREMIDRLDELNSNLEYSFASTGWSNPTYKITKNNRIVDINYHCIVSGGIAAYKYYVATLPEDVRPSATRNSVGWVANNGVRYAASVEINKNGTISLVAGGSFEEAGFAATFIV